MEHYGVYRISFGILVFLLALVASYVFANEQMVIGLQGQSITLQCNTSQGNVNASWEKDGVKIIFNISKYKRVSPDEIEVLKLTQSDTGTYKCYVEDRIMHTVILKVQSKPEFTDLFQSQRTMAGSNLKLQCVVVGSPQPKITWFKDKTFLKTNPNIDITTSAEISDKTVSSELHIKMVTLSDAGVYRCAAENAHGWTSHDAEIKVYTGVEFVSRPQDGATGVKSVFTFDCSVKGNPIPKIVWLKETTVLSNDSWFAVTMKTKVQEFLVESVLTVKNARRVDSGVYKCLGVNSFGRGTSQAKLSVLERPDPVTLRVVAVGPKWIELEWTAGFNGNLRIKDYIVRYNSTIFLSSQTTSDTRIKLENLTPESLYRIGVAATNIIGRSDMTYVFATTLTEYIPSSITVRVTKFTSRSVTIAWHRNHSTHLSEKTYGLEVLIYRQGNIVENRTSYQTEASSTLTISNLDPFTFYSITTREVYKVIFRGPYTEFVNFTTAEDAPSRPRNVTTLGISKKAILLLWNPPEFLNGLIREYEIRYSHVDDQSSFAVVTRQKNILTKEHKDRRVVLENLTAFTKYQIGVRERTLLNKWSPESSASGMTLEDVPSKPPANAGGVKLNDTTYLLSWQPIPISDVRGILRGYKVFSFLENGEKHAEISLNSSISKVTLYNLRHYTIYRNTIVGTTNAGNGPGAVVSFRTPEGRPSAPRDLLSGSRSPDKITLEWKPPVMLNGIILRYQVLWKKLGVIRERRSLQDNKEFSIEKDVVSQKNRRETIVNLEPFSVYRFRVRERTSKGWGPFSSFINGSTAESNPSKPVDLQTVLVTDSSATVSWKQPAKPNGLIQYYLILCWDGINLVQNFKVYKSKNITENAFQAKVQMLESGKKYVIEVRAVNGLTGKADQVTVLISRGQKATNKEMFPWLPLIAGCVGGIILIALVTATALLCTRKKKYTEIDGNQEDTPMNGFVKNRPIHITHLKHYVQQNHANSDHGFYTEYESIKVPMTSFTWENSQQPYNQQKNRYSNIVAYDHSRVVLSSIDNLQGSSYINASFIDGYKYPRKFIATQGPLPHTIADFWRMVWEQKSHVVVMLTKLVEDSRVKCEQYWPSQGSITYKNLMLTSLNQTEMTDYMLRTFALSNVAEPHHGKREILHYHFTAWPDHGVPEHPTAMVMFIRHVMGSLPIKPGPIIVHCSAGVGRTGTFIVIDAMLSQIKEEGVVDVFGFVSHIRRQRNFMVQTEAQYIFIYNALLDAVICGNTEIAAQDLLSKLRYLNQHDPDTGETYLRDEFKRLEAGPGSSEKMQFLVASHSDNKLKNRFLNILPYDRNRVKLAQIAGFRGSDYINASYIDGYQKRRAFIATQAPLAGTLQDFWRMIWEQNCHCIVMLTKLTEKGQERCHQYWPPFGTEMYGKIMVDNLAEDDTGEYFAREFHVTHTESGKSRRVKHFMFVSWPQHGSPSTGAGMIQLLGDVQKSQQASGNGPIVVHCSGGVGRTGAFIALCNCIERLKLEGIIDLFQTVRQLRTQRPAMVQTIDQYYFCYQALKDYLDSFDLYSNFA